MSILSRIKFEFTINTLFIGLLFLIIGSGVTSYWLTKTDPYEPPTGSLPVPVQVGKNKIIVSKTGDASMQTEYRRRRAIIGSNGCGISPKFSYQGSTNGSLETYFLSSMCPTFVKKAAVVCSTLYDGGDATTESCNILNGGDAYTTVQDMEVDLGDAYTTTVCFI
jgi:hypothetical protein